MEVPLSQMSHLDLNGIREVQPVPLLARISLKAFFGSGLVFFSPRGETYLNTFGANSCPN